MSDQNAPSDDSDNSNTPRASSDEIERSERLWRAVLTAALDPIVLIDADGIILQANPATTELFGYPIDELVGHNVSVLMPEPYRSEHDGYIQRYLETGEARIIGIGREVTAQKADGTIFPMSLAVTEVGESDDRMFTGIIHDLTGRHLAEQRLREANERLEDRVEERTLELERSMEELARSNRDLEQFAYIASHDLQAPLRNVRQGLELLDEHLVETAGQGFDEEANELRGLIVDAVERMEDLIRGLLDYSRVRRSPDPSGTIVDLGALLSEVLEQLQFELGEARAEVTVDDLPTVVGDRTQLRQLLQNLIHNAIKYRAPDRAPAIRVGASDVDGHWVVSVTDNGVGVDAEQHERIFELFRRGHPGYEGVGLGLAICQRIVERHGGTIWVDSDPGRGATFTFTLPTTSAPATTSGGPP